MDERQFDRMMNDLGARGWELTAAYETNRRMGGNCDLVAIFKRERQ
ncbi:MAG: DUF4177 domain-containing protein [Prosthecobacter sp.]